MEPGGQVWNRELSVLSGCWDTTLQQNSPYDLCVINDDLKLIIQIPATNEERNTQERY